MAPSDRGPKIRTISGRVLLFFGISAMCGILVAGFFFPWATSGGAAAQVGNDVLDENPADFEEEPIGVPSRILASDGTELAVFFAENRQPVEIDEMAQSLQDAVVAIEDERFYEHSGTDLRGIARAVASNITSDSTQGASTITHQYVSQLILNSEQANGAEEATTADTTVADRLNEARLAVDIEEEMSKDEILAGYLNIILLGGRNYGVEAASQYFWGISASELDVAQSALLAGLIQNPNGLNPESNPDGAIERRDSVLDAMLRNDYITQEEHDQASEQELNVDTHERSSGCYSAEMGPYFCDYVVRNVLEDDAFGETKEDRENLLNRGGLEITTTLDPDLQQEAENQVDSTVPADDPSQAGSTLVSVEPGTGRIRAMAQNTEYSPDEETTGNTTLNFNVDSNAGGGNGFQAGSTIKPFVGAAWIDSGNSMTDTVDASKSEYDQDYAFDARCLDGGQATIPDENGWSISNAIEDMDKEMTVDFGLYWSINTATVATLAELDVCDVTDLTTSLGVHRADDGEPLNPRNASFVLGAEEVSPLTQANAFAAFAADGTYCRPRAIEEVTDAEGNSYPVPEQDCEQAVDSNVVAQLNQTLTMIAEERVADGDPQFPMAGKTGTNNSQSSSWFVGYSSGLATASWVGNYQGLESLQGTEINGTTHENFWGSTLAAPMWLDYMNEVGDSYETEEFTAPEDSDFDDPEDTERYAMDGDGTE